MYSEHFPYLWQFAMHRDFAIYKDNLTYIWQNILLINEICHMYNNAVNNEISSRKNVLDKIKVAPHH